MGTKLDALMANERYQEVMDQVMAGPMPLVEPHADVLNPTHYSCYEIEPIDFIEANKIPYSEGNVIKYVCRWRMKDGVRDLIKAREYLDKLIERNS